MTTRLPSFPAAGESPLATCVRLREIAPVVEVEFPGGVPAYLALTHNAVREILAGDNKTFLRDPEHWPALHDGSIPDDWPLRAIVQGGHLSTKDGDDHRRLRGLVGKAFTPARVKALEPRIQQIVDGLLDDVVAAGDGVDMVPAFTEALPMWVICELFGVPAEERPQMRDWTARLLAHTTPPEEAFATQNALQAYLHELVERRQRIPGDDLTSSLVQARDENDRLTTDELVGVLWLMLVAGHETTVHLLGNAIVALDQNPDQLKSVKAEHRWDDVVEETLRYRHSVMMTSFRFTAEDVTIAGVRIPKGQAVGVVYQASGLDPAEYGDTADTFDFTREQNQRLVFGHGPRYCIGAALARMEGRLALSALYRRLPELALTIDPADIPYSPSFFTVGPLSLPVALGTVRP
ncbi:cytochrome P450 family protein [Actinomadura madurae]|uniref:cytochrome P450 family protein n=1 Tax=Actinomadura madurae TaxID=1993 RepID=UPI002026C9EC|nr:cytochrome P450 [Actinomadura madurae]MCP9977662.1 cytochrome P450 [Actinomadura madurae]MCQ0010844.1 cytochrome P450 [Actinomadura madurae]MCQ0013847.1 cytochrome P450 [Actinomadura madurae]URN04749.1 cytochrome P450 [Actinomadura madurae]